MTLRLRSRIKGRYSPVRNYGGMPRPYFEWSPSSRRYVISNIPLPFDPMGYNVIAYIDSVGGIMQVTLDDNTIVTIHSSTGKVRLSSIDDLDNSLEFLGDHFTESMRRDCIIPHRFYLYLARVLRHINGESVIWD